jgi:hypothetical protein
MVELYLIIGEIYSFPYAYFLKILRSPSQLILHCDNKVENYLVN